jgi:hypothetical protein
MTKLTADEFKHLGGSATEYIEYELYVEEVFRKMNLPVQQTSKIVLNPFGHDNSAVEFILEENKYPFIGNKYYCKILGRLSMDGDFYGSILLEKYNSNGNINAVIASTWEKPSDSIPVFSKKFYINYSGNISKLKSYLSLVTDIDEDKINIYVEEEVVQVVVHQISNFPIYFFNTQGYRHLVNIESSPKNPGKYVIKISRGNTSQFTLECKTTGTLYKTVLLKRLNDWFKVNYGRRATFTWGDPVAVE